MQETGYYVDKNRQIVGPDGIIGLSVNDDNYLVKNGNEIDVYIEDGFFFRSGKKVFFFFSISSPTGHQLTKDGKIIGSSDKLPWDGLV